MALAPVKKTPLIKLKGSEVVKMRSPQFAAKKCEYEKWRLSYEGGDKYLDFAIRRYSKRETIPDWQERKKLSYNSNHTKRIVNNIRNSLAVKLPEVTRKGDAGYLKIVQEDIDGKKTSLNQFLALNVIPWLLVLERVFVYVDAPPKAENATKAEDDGQPYCWMIPNDRMLAWNKDDVTGKLRSALIAESEDIIDPETLLVSKCVPRFRYVRYLKVGETFQGFTGEGVVVLIMDKDGKIKKNDFIAELTQLPLAEFEIPCSLVEDIAQIQYSLTNIQSTDIQFLIKGNFPIFAKQIPANKKLDPKLGNRKQPDDTVVRSQNREFDETDFDIGTTRKALATGIGSGITYEKDMVAPGFIAPPVANLQAAMAKEKDMEELIQLTADLAMTTLSIKALEQSGKSKEMDAIGRDAGLYYIGTVLEGGERVLAELITWFLGSTTEAAIDYPDDYSDKSQDDRNTEVEGLQKLKTAVRSEVYQKTIDKRIAEVGCRLFTPTEDIEAIKTDIDGVPWFDESTERSAMINQDVTAGVMSTTTGSEMRGLDPVKEAAANEDAMTKQADLLSGGIVQPAGELDDQGNPIPPTDPNKPVIPPANNKPAPFVKGAPTPAPAKGKAPPFGGKKPNPFGKK